ncbi:MAG: putative endonuclease 4 [Desulfovibrio sp.]
MGREALSINANTFQFFTRNPRGTAVKPLDEADAAALAALLREHAFAPVIAHAPYILNPCSAKENLRELAKEILADDIARMEHLPGNYYNLHPGSHTGQGMDTGVAQVAKCLNTVLFTGMRTTVLLETMAGKGSEVGGRFEDIARIMEKVTCGEYLGVCLDTCHVWDAGYDIVDRLDETLETFDRVIGLTHLKAVHINDSVNALGARKDRHAKIGEGAIGTSGMRRIINHPALRLLPFCLETPNDVPGYAKEIALLREMRCM